MPEGATGSAVAVRKNTSRLLFAPETFNFAEVTRAIEVARRMPSDVECVFAGFSRRNSEYIRAAGFEFRLLTPHLSDEEGRLALAFDQGRSLRHPFTTQMLAQRVTSERVLLRCLRPDAVVIGVTPSQFISARAECVPLVFVRPFAYSLAHLEAARRVGATGFLPRATPEDCLVDAAAARLLHTVGTRVPLSRSFHQVAKANGVSLPQGVFAARTRATLEAMPQAAPDTHYTGVATSADTIEHITTMSGGDADNGEIAIEEHVTAHQDGTTTRSWTVDIRGTQSFMVGESGPQDSLSNLQGVAAMPSDQLDAVKEAMRAAGIGPGEAVEFAGHSQGGIMAAQLAADPQVRADYNVVSVLTAGSPTATVAPSDVPVLAYENFGDIVPGCDGEATRGDNVTTVMFRDYAAATHTEDPVPSSHSAPLYVDEIRTTLNAAKASSDPGLSALAAAEARRTQALGLTDNTHTTIHHYQTRRITQK